MNEPIDQLTCANHPNVQTTLRCNRCEKPICARCAVRTPTGYRCKECVSGMRKVFDTSRWYDYPLAFAVAAILGYIGSRVASFLGFFTLFIAPIAGVIIAEAVRKLLNRRRSPRLYWTAAAGAAIGSLPLLVILGLRMFLLLSAGSGSLGFLLPIVWQFIYTFMVTSTVYVRLSGIQIRS
jgi:hypothetical protein